MKHILFHCLSFLFFTLSAQEDSLKRLHDVASDNIADVLFDSKAKPIRDRAKAFENANGIKIQYRVENQSLAKLGGLSEHLFKLFQTFTSNENVNAKVITGEFSVLQNDALSDVMRYKTNATNDLTQCRLPLTDTQKKDSLYSKFLQNGLLSSEELNLVPENLNGLYPQAISDYENILNKHSDCPDVFNSSSYNQHVFNTKQLRANEWTSDINALSVTISSSYGLLSSSNSNTISPKNNGSTRVNLNIDPKIFQGHYVLNTNKSMNECTQEDLEVRCRMLYNKTGIHFLFVTFDLNYFLPVDSMNTFRDAAVQTFSTNYTDNVIVALYLRMKDGNSYYGSTLLIKQINGSWLTQADINFANYNNGGTYIGGTVSRFNNVFKNIPKPLILCYQVAKVNGLLSTAYFIKSNEAKGKEQIYVHVLKLDKAFDELKQLDDQLHHLIVSTGGSGGSQMGTTGYVNSAVYDEIDQVRNKIKIAYVKAARTPSFMDADVRFKEVYLQDTDVVESASLNYLKSKYGSIFKNNRLETLSASHPPPQDLVVGSCKTQDESDVIADGLNLASFILSPTGLDFIPDALSVAYYASTDQLTEAIWASSAFLMPGIGAGAKKVVSSVVDAIKEMNAGSRLIKEAGQLQAIQQDKNLIAGLFNIKPENINSSLATKIKDNPTSVNQLLLTTEKEAKLYSHVSNKLNETKRVEFLNKSLDEPSWRQKVLDDPDEVLKWAGVVDLKWLDDLEFVLGPGTKSKITNWINNGVNPVKVQAAFNKSSNKSELFVKLESSLSVYHQRVHIEDWDNIPGISKTNYIPNGMTTGKTSSNWNNTLLDLPAAEASNFVDAVAIELPAGTKIYRVTGGNSAGAYWTLQKPNSISDVIGGTAVQPEWNSFEKIYEYQVPSNQGLKVWKGQAAKQPISQGVTNPHLPGGAEQIYIPNTLRDNSFKNLIQEITLPW